MIADSIPHGGPEMLRADILEMANRIAIQADLVVTYASIGDDTGLAYAVRNLALYTKMLLASAGDLADMKAMKHAETCHG